MGSGVWFWSAEQKLDLGRGSVAGLKSGELNTGRRRTVMWVFPNIQYIEIVV
jgi:hypothetical protein